MRNISEEVKNRILRYLTYLTYGEIRAFSSIKDMKDYYEKPDASVGTDLLHNLMFDRGIEDKFTLSDSTGSIDTKFGSIASILVYLGKKWVYYHLKDGEQLGIVVGFYNKDENIFYIEQVHKLRPTTKSEDNYELGLLRA